MTLSDSQLAAAKARAEAWFRDGSEVALTRDNAINEEHLALDIIELLAEIERLRAELAERAQPACRGLRHYFSGGYGGLCQCQRTMERR